MNLGAWGWLLDGSNVFDALWRYVDFYFIVFLYREFQMGARYKIENPLGEDGLLYVSLQNNIPKWTLSIWKRQGGSVFPFALQKNLKRLVPKFREIPNEDYWHTAAHAYAPEEFNQGSNYMRHIHISSNSLVKKATLHVFLNNLKQLGFLSNDEVGKILVWAEGVLGGVDEASDSELESDSQ